MRASFVLLALFAITGCVAQSSSQGAQAQFERFASDATLAQLIADECPSYTMREPIEALTQSYIGQLIAAGVSEADAAAAIQATPESVIVDRTIERMIAGGVRQGDTASLCQFGAAQVAQRTQVGQFLR